MIYTLSKLVYIFRLLVYALDAFNIHKSYYVRQRMFPNFKFTCLSISIFLAVLFMLNCLRHEPSSSKPSTIGAQERQTAI